MLKYATKVKTTLPALTETYGIGILVTLWFCIQMLLHWKFGVKLVPDSTYRYIPYASQLAETGKLVESQENRYILYIAFLLFFLKLHAGLKAAILAQIFISGVACIFFYKTVKHVTGHSHITAFITTVVFILWKDLQYHNNYILTESLFTSFIIFVMYGLARSKNMQGYVTSLALCILPALLRPNGFVILAGVIVCMAYHYRSSLIKYKKAAVYGGFAVFILLLIILDRYLLTTFHIIETYARGEVIYATDLLSVSADKVVMPTEKDSPILRILYFILQNPLFFFKLFFSKLLVYLAYAKPYYSLLHNASIFAIIYPLYFFTGWYMVKGRYHVLKLFALTAFLLQALIVATTSEDWDSRFIIPFLPVFMVLGAAGITHYLKQKFDHER